MSITLAPDHVATLAAGQDRRHRDLGRAYVMLVKAGGERPVAAPVLAGRLVASDSGWLLLTVPNALVHGLFDAMDEEGIELPPGHAGGQFNAHVSVMTGDEVESLGGPGKISERGHNYLYQLGPIKSVEPAGWSEMSRAWFVEVQSPELKALRRSYGLTPLPRGDHQFHITVAVRRRNVLKSNDVRKAASRSDGEIDAGRVVAEIRRAIRELPPLMPGYGDVYYNPEERKVYVVAGDSDDREMIDTWRRHLLAIDGVDTCDAESEYVRPDIGTFREARPPWIKVAMLAPPPALVDAIVAEELKQDAAVPAPPRALPAAITRNTTPGPLLDPSPAVFNAATMNALVHEQLEPDGDPFPVPKVAALLPNNAAMVTALLPERRMKVPVPVARRTRRPISPTVLAQAEAEAADVEDLIPMLRARRLARLARPNAGVTHVAAPGSPAIKLGGDDDRQSDHGRLCPLRPRESGEVADHGIHPALDRAPARSLLPADAWPGRPRDGPALGPHPVRGLGGTGVQGLLKRALDPVATGALIGAGLGGLGGYALGHKTKHPWLATLAGAGAGGVAGAVGGGLRDPAALRRPVGHLPTGEWTSPVSPPDLPVVGTREESLADNIAYDYRGAPGGLAGAVARAVANRKPVAGMSDLGFTAEDVGRKVPVTVTPPGGGMTPLGAMNMASEATRGRSAVGLTVPWPPGDVHVYAEEGDSPAKAHELTHAALDVLPVLAGRARPQRVGVFGAYDHSPSELVPWASELKRRFIRDNWGRDVTTPAEAHEALRWVTGGEEPNLPPDVLRKLTELMPQVVSHVPPSDTKTAADFAPGLPTRKNYGDLTRLQPGQVLDYVVQHHRAHRAGPHYDVRIGSRPTGMYSWAAPKGVPVPGEKHLAVRQPLHRHAYNTFEGTIPRGYGAGTVKTHDLGQVLVTKVGPDHVHFTTAHRRHPERFVMLRPRGFGKAQDWLLANVTPTEKVPFEKLHYRRVPHEQVESAIRAMGQGGTVEAKVDGASQLVRLVKGHAEHLSFRTSKETGRPIIHEERVFHGRPRIDYPPHLEGSVLKGELYASPGAGHAAGPQDVGTLLNSSVARSLQLQREQGVRIRNMLYDIQRYGNKTIGHDVPRPERRRMMDEVLAHLPPETFHASEAVPGGEPGVDLWRQVREGRHPLTREGVILHPERGVPIKGKLTEDHDVYITGTFPGEGKRSQTVGGFTYGHEPGKTVGRVGTGFSDAFLREVAGDPSAYIGRVARVKAQERLPSGALRAPAFVALHEDTNKVKAAGLTHGMLAAALKMPDTYGPDRKPSWTKHVMTRYDSTHPPKGIFARSADEIVAAGSDPEVAPRGLRSWQNMVVFHRNRGGARLGEDRRAVLQAAIARLSEEIRRGREKDADAGRVVRAAPDGPLPVPVRGRGPGPGGTGDPDVAGPDGHLPAPGVRDAVGPGPARGHGGGPDAAYPAGAAKSAALLPSVQLQPQQRRVAGRVNAYDPRLLVYHGLGSGKCVRGDTPILVDTGLTTIAALFGDLAEGPEAELVIPGEGYVVAHVDGIPAWALIRSLYRRRLAEDEATNRVETIRGSWIEPTGEHRLLRAKDGKLDWPSISDIRPGDHLAMVGSIPDPPAPFVIDEDLAVLLAWQVTEGHERPDIAAASITQANLPLLEDLRARFRRLVPASQSGHIAKVNTSSPCLVIQSIEYRKLLDDHGYVWGRLSGDKALPCWFVALDRGLLRKMLRCIFDAEGHVGVGNIELTLKSPELLGQVQYALLRFGIRSSWHAKWGAATNGSRIRRRYYRISISGEDVAKFRDEVGFDYAYKQAALDLLVSREPNPNHGIPIGDVLEVLRALGILKATGMSATVKRTCSIATCRTLIARLRWLLSADAVAHYEARIARYGGTAGKFSVRTLAVITAQRAEIEACIAQIESLIRLDVRFEPVFAVSTGMQGGFVYDIEVDLDDFNSKNYAAGVGAFVSHNSLASLAAAERSGEPYTAVVPAALRPNYNKEISKFTDTKTPHSVMSYTQAGMGITPNHPPGTLILDEVQRLRNPASAATKAVKDMATRADRVMLLSGTPVVNRPNDLAVPLSLLTNRDIDPHEFDRRFVGKKEVSPGFLGWLQGVKPVKVPAIQHEDELEDMLRGHVDYHPSRTPEGVSTDEERVVVDMSPQQKDFYRLMWNRLPWLTRWKMKNDYPMTASELKNLQSFMTGPRQAALSLYPFQGQKDPHRAFQESAKLRSAFANAQETLASDPRAKVLAYSNFIDAGLVPYEAALKAHGIPYSILHGRLNDAERKAQLDAYNSGRSRVLLLGPSAAEGISAQGTQLIQLLDPHWNEARMGQARGRGLRFDSHEGLPEGLRNVKIQRYIARMPEPGFFGRLLGGARRPSADEFLEAQSRRKEELNDQFRDVLRRVGSEPPTRPWWSLFG